MKKIFIIFMVGFLGTALIGCGQKGSIYLPDDEEAQEATA